MGIPGIFVAKVNQPEFQHQSWTGCTWVKVNREKLKPKWPLHYSWVYDIWWYMNLSLETSREFLMLLDLCLCIDYSRGNLSQWTTTTLLQEIGGWRNIIHPECLVQNDSSRISPRMYRIFVQTSSTEYLCQPEIEGIYRCKTSHTTKILGTKCPSFSRSLAVLAVLLGDIYVVALLHPLRPVSQKLWKMGRWTGKVTLFVGSHWWKIG